MRDSAEIIWYDFKEQALDLISRTDGLLDEVVDGAWYKRT